MPSLHFSFECETRKIKSQYAGGILLPPVQTPVATSICAYGADANESRHLGRNRQFSLRKLAVLQ